MAKLHRVPAAYRVLRAIRLSAGSVFGARRVPGVSGRVHFNDLMFAMGGAHYAASGKEVVRILGESLKRCGRDFSSVSSCLEIGSGYGRIVRELVKALPPATISACDAVAEGPEFCAKEFGVNAVPLYSMACPGAYDLVYLISVFTHLDLEYISEMLADITASLKPGGVLIFTTHGEVSARKIEIYGSPWREKKTEIIQQLTTTGFFYEKYSWYKTNIGMTWITEARMKNLLHGLRLVSCEPAGLEGHQDIFTYTKPLL